MAHATLPAALASHAASRPHAIALYFEGQAISYGDLWRRIEAATQTLMALGLKVEATDSCGPRVAYLGLNSPAQLVLLVALQRLGAVGLPLNYRLAPAEFSAILLHAQASLLVADEMHAAVASSLLPDLRTVAAALFDGTASLRHAGVHITEPPPSEPALLVYTSGTTGSPRAAVHTQANLVANMRIAAQVQQITDQDRVLTVLPLFHVGGLCIQTLPALYAGASVTLLDRFGADATLDALANERPSLTLQVPATMQALVDHPRWPQADLSCLRAVWAGSSVLPVPLVRAFLDRGVPLCNVYGATETGPFSIALPPAAAHTHGGSCGWPAPGVEAMLGGGKQGSGELLVRGPNVVARYWPDQPACDGHGWFHTGDLATRAADGSYTVTGRSSDLIISGGENIHPLEIEAALCAHPAVAECAAFGLNDARWGEAVAVAVVLHVGAALSDDALRDHLAGRLARFKLPRRVFFVEALPKTALGKVQRAALKALAN